MTSAQQGVPGANASSWTGMGPPVVVPVKAA